MTLRPHERCHDEEARKDREIGPGRPGAKALEDSKGPTCCEASAEGAVMNDDAGPLTPFEEVELVEWAEAAVRAAKVPRLYVTFLADDGQTFTVGPVLSVAVQGERLVASSGSDAADPSGHDFTLATFDGDGWRVNDGMESAVFARWRCHAVPPAAE
jgi:hypothetical protein